MAAPAVAGELARRIEDLQPRIIEWRRDLHQNPELSNREFRTSKVVADHLRRLGLPVETGIAKTGVVALLEGGLPMALTWAAMAVLVLLALLRALRGTSGVPRAQAVFSTGTLTIVTLHSLVDYPFRSMALAGLVGVAVAFVLVPPARSGNLKS
jgi:hypothetical protein